MEFRLTQEQHMIRETAQAFLADVSSPADVRVAMSQPDSYTPEIWSRLCSDLCLQAITIPEEYGGLGMGYVDLAIVLEEMGRKLFCSPFLATVGLATNAILLAATEAQKQQWLPGIAEGKTTAALAWTGAEAARHGGDWGVSAVSVICETDGNNYRLNGELRYVIDGDTADLLIIAARAPRTSGEQGISLFAVPAESVGIERRWTPTMDQTRRQATITMTDLFVTSEQLLGSAGEAWPVLARTLALAKISLAAEQAGVAGASLDMAVAYTLEREQFGRVIAGYQAIKHKAADMKLKSEVALSAVYYAACVASEVLDPEGSAAIAAELEEAAAMAKGYCSDTAFFNAGSALQLFGGVGFTAEYDIQLYFKRAKASELYLGNGAAQRELVAELLLESGDSQ
ncbi:acyl-CoA dehydrogenase family protein [uncultured Marinobacter sp.]|uniref:acyl-CoA dehydrogenase family protein n=1 Tax=uncultured Marinobacter sp. TaxID=187379 RepID=UPI00262A0ED4|nr:acyl-CoA dehydrogenase family protein [uncultured Marinobacter sp.]